ncbi:hypothetical protein [Streptomyces sp. NPDC048639]
MTEDAGPEQGSDARTRGSLSENIGSSRTALPVGRPVALSS